MQGATAHVGDAAAAPHESAGGGYAVSRAHHRADARGRAAAAQVRALQGPAPRVRVWLQQGRIPDLSVSIQGNHLHLGCEAGSAGARARGIQGWAVRVARGINGVCGRRGTVFADRYHMEVLTTPTQVRNALCYVLQNARRHGVRLDPRFHGADPLSSAWWFDGWKDASWKKGLAPPEQRTVADAESWLLRVGWQRAHAGTIAIDEVPAAARGRAA